MTVNHNALEIRFGNAEADVLAAGELRFELPPPAVDLAAQIFISLECAIGVQILRAGAISALIDVFLAEFYVIDKVITGLIDGLLAEFYEVDALISAMRAEQRRVRVEIYSSDEETTT